MTQDELQIHHLRALCHDKVVWNAPTIDQARQQIWAAADEIERLRNSIKKAIDYVPIGSGAESVLEAALEPRS